MFELFLHEWWKQGTKMNTKWGHDSSQTDKNEFQTSKRKLQTQSQTYTHLLNRNVNECLESCV